MTKTLHSLLPKRFKASKCKTLLKLTTARIKLLRNKAQAVVKQTRRDVAQLLQNSQEPSAQNRAELVYREENTLAAYDLIEQYCELVVNRLPIISAQKLCPPDLKEAISSLIFAAPRCADLHELQEVRHIFEAKYGKEFVVAAAELRPDCGVSSQIIEKLSSRSPAEKVKLKLMKEIAAENKIEWDPKDALDEPVKPPEVLLDGSKQFPSGSQVLTSDTGQDNCLAEQTTTVSAAHGYPPPGPALPTSSNPDSYSEEDARLAEGKFLSPGNYDSLTLDTSKFTGHANCESQKGTLAFKEIHKADVYVPHSRAKADRCNEGCSATEGETNLFPKSEKSISSSAMQQAEASFARGSNLKYQDVASAAQAAYESAAQAAAAARMIIDLAKHDPRNYSTNNAGFQIEEDLDNATFSSNSNVSQVEISSGKIRIEKELDSFEVLHTKKAQAAKSNSRPTSEEEVDSLKVDHAKKSAQHARNSVNSLNTKEVAQVAADGASSESEEVDDSKVPNTKKHSQVTRNVSAIAHNNNISSSNNLDISSESEHERNDVQPFMDCKSQYSSTNLMKNLTDGNSDYDNEADQVSLPAWKYKDTSSMFSRYEAKPEKPSHFSSSMGPIFYDNDGERDDGNSMFSPTRAQPAIGSYFKSAETNSSFSKADDQGQDKPSPLEEGGLRRDQLDQRWKTEEKASSLYESQAERDACSHLERPVFDDYVEPAGLPEKWSLVRCYNEPEAVFDDGSEISKTAETGYKGKPSTLNKSQGSTCRNLKWHSRSSEGHDSPPQSSDMRFHEPEELLSTNSGFHYEAARPTDHNLDVSPPVRSKLYPHGSRRSVRSVRSQQSKERGSKEGDVTLYGMPSSILEDTQCMDDQNFNKASCPELFPSGQYEGASVIDISQKESENRSAVSRSISSSLFCGSSLQPSPSSDPSNLAAPGVHLLPNHSHELLSSQVKTGVLPSDLSDSLLPNDDEFTARLEALRRKH